MKPKFSAIKARLKLVPKSEEELDLEHFPDFMIIGPQRTGTTWLHENLVEHPQVFMPRQKEIYYFNSLPEAKHHPKHLPPVEPDLGWYLSLFAPTEGYAARRESECRTRFGESFEIAVRGEATATYAAHAVWRPQMIDDILLLNPDIKIMTMVRDPIERAWSHAKKDLSKMAGRRVDDVSLEEWEAFVRKPYQILCGQYSRYHGVWEARIKPENLFVGRFSDVASNPEGLLLRAFEFLGIRADAKYITQRAHRRANPTAAVGVPDELLGILEDLFADEVELLKSQDLL